MKQLIVDYVIANRINIIISEKQNSSINSINIILFIKF